MKKNIVISRGASLMLLLTYVAFTGCSCSGTQETKKTPGVHKMGAAPMSDAKHPGKLPDDSTQ